MSESTAKPILVTGSHRSGSTWTGKMIAISPDIGYVHEPFNLRHRPGICKAKFETWFPYVCDENEQHYLDDIQDCLHFKYHLSKEVGVAKSLKDLLRLSRDYSQFEIYRILKKRPLLKDPIAVFSAQWLAKRFNMDVIVLIRHPAAFVGSIKAAKWAHPFDHFLQQPLLMEHYLTEYRSQIEEFSRTDKDFVDQAILLWNLIHHVILRYREERPDWTFIKHEALSEDPVAEFGKIYQKLGIRFSTDIQKKIESYSSAETGRDNLKQLERDSKSNIWTWKTRLTNEEIKKVRAGTAEVARAFYAEESWVH